MIDRFKKATVTEQKEVVVTIVSQDSATGAYVVLYAGTSIGPVWSANNVQHAVGANVKAIVERGVIKFLVP